jgi:hypothetical protein
MIHENFSRDRFVLLFGGRYGMAMFNCLGYDSMPQ